MAWILTGWLTIAIVTGCGRGTSAIAERDARISSLLQEKDRTGRLLEQLETRNSQLEASVRSLASLPPQAKVAYLQRLQKVQIGRYTNLYDKDGDGRNESLIVYVKTVDKDGDAIKTPADVKIELWDLERPDGQAMLGAWRVDAEQLCTKWMATLMAIHYRLQFEAPPTADRPGGPLAVKMEFTDSLTGMTFRDQRLIEPAENQQGGNVVRDGRQGVEQDK